MTPTLFHTAKSKMKLAYHQLPIHWKINIRANEASNYFLTGINPHHPQLTVRAWIRRYQANALTEQWFEHYKMNFNRTRQVEYRNYLRSKYLFAI